MSLYTLNYDLRKQRNYQPLYDELAKFNTVRVLESCWCFKRFNISATGLREVIAHLNLSNSGRFIAYDGKPIAW